MPLMGEESPELCGGDPRDGERRQFILVEEAHAVHFRKRTAAQGVRLAGAFVVYEGTVKEHLVAIERHGGVAVPVAIVDGQQLVRTRAIARLFIDLAHHGLARRLFDIGPAARQRPQAIGPLTDQQDRPIAKDGPAHIHFGRNVADFASKEIAHLGKLDARTTCHHLGSNLPDSFVAFDIVRIFAIGQAIVSGSLELSSPVQPRVVRVRTHAFVSLCFAGPVNHR
jgi:hypothetical protein